MGVAVFVLGPCRPQSYVDGRNLRRIQHLPKPSQPRSFGSPAS